MIIVLDFEAAKGGIKGLPVEQIPSFWSIVPKMYLLFPIALLVGFLILGYSPFRAAFIGIVAAFVLSMLHQDTRFSITSFIEAINVAAKRAVMIAMACAAAGIVVGVITLTGVGLSLSSLIMTLSGGNILIGLILIMVSTIIMGMGTPTTAAYVIVATLAVPVMRNFGFDPLSSHFFVFYGAVLSMFTPPVAIAAYAAADIAKEDGMKIGFQSMRIAFVAFIIPFVCVLDKGLLFDAPLQTVLYRTIATVISIVMFAGAATGWFSRPLSMSWRFLFMVVFILVNLPKVQFSLIGIMASLILGFQFFISKNKMQSFSKI